MQTYHYVSDYRHIVEKTDVLEGAGNALVVDFFLAVAAKLLSVKVEGARGGKIYAGEHIEDGCLARSVRAYQSVKLLFLNFKIKVLYRLQTAEGDAEIFRF